MPQEPMPQGQEPASTVPLHRPVPALSPDPARAAEIWTPRGSGATVWVGSCVPSQDVATRRLPDNLGRPLSAGKIHSIEAIAVDIPLTRNFGGSTYSVLKRSTVVTRLRTADGLVGQVYNGDNRAHGPEIAHLVRDVLAPQVTGLSIMES